MSIATILSSAQLPTRFGSFRLHAFDGLCDSREHVAIVKGEISGQANVLTRVHSECLTGDALGSLRCDCRDQLIMSLEAIEKAGSGVVVYLRQEGRGIGLRNKIKAYALQDQGLDTLEADHQLGFSGDERSYTVAAEILQTLQITSVRLLTNNPAKISALADLGVVVTERVPIVTLSNPYNLKYLQTKQQKAGHLF